MNASFTQQFQIIEETIASKLKYRGGPYNVKEWELYVLYVCCKHTGNTHKYFPLKDRDEWRNEESRRLLYKFEEKFQKDLCKYPQV